MAAKARKFKRKLALKPTRKKAEPVLSVELIRKESLQKIKQACSFAINGLWKKLISRFKTVKLAN